MWECIVNAWAWLGSNSGQVQIIIALIAVYYVYYQIKLFKKQRYFELRLQLIEFIYQQLNVVNAIKLKTLKIKIFSKHACDLTKVERELIDGFLEISDSTEDTLVEMKECLEIMLDSVNDDCDVFTIKELEVELKEAMERIKDIRDFHDRYDKLIVMLDKDNPLK
ncbi:hypothetical protein [Acinetobacter sp. 18QD2AZ41W]|uniref:hypothetical protein n=1 Tax=Acinetobacter sp. 18QD2AZ41W TaxID=2692137 RepID=UPI001358A957|nr:hypothetical protein [Acinetobacter sp. 18QD2AZ41W]